MTIIEIIQWLEDKMGRPAPPVKVAMELSRCDGTGVDAGRYDTLLAGLRLRYYNATRKQFTAEQDAAIEAATQFGKAGGANATAFPNLKRAKIALQAIARIMDPSLVNQGQTNLCGPASVVMSMVKSRPLFYVQTLRSLADKGSAYVGKLKLTPRQSILMYDRTNPSEVDWIMAASLRNDSTAVTDSMHGVSGSDDMFNWLVGSGYSQVVTLLKYPLESSKVYPTGGFPVDASMNKEKMVMVMDHLSQKGWQIFLFAFGEIATSTRTLAGKYQSVLDNSDDAGRLAHTQNALNISRTTELGVLRSENLSRISLAWNSITGSGAQHTLHLTYVERFRVIGQDVEITCYNWGNNTRWVRLPFDAFVNKFCGFAAALG